MRFNWANLAGARVLATVRPQDEEVIAHTAGAAHVLRADLLSTTDLIGRVQEHAPNGVDHIVEVSFDENIILDEAVLAQGGSIAAYATNKPSATVPFWPLAFKNARLFFLGIDDFPMELQAAAAADLNRALRAGWSGFAIRSRFSLAEVAQAHKEIEQTPCSGRVILTIRDE